jgi:hypothetical protein
MCFGRSRTPAVIYDDVDDYQIPNNKNKNEEARDATMGFWRVILYCTVGEQKKKI